MCTISIPYLNIFNLGVSSSAVRKSNKSRFEESNEVGFVSGGTQR
jgi:cbb3-type cytochrome oxidase subunit 3